MNLKEKLKLDKTSKGILAVLFIYLIVMVIIFLPGYIRKQREKIYIVTNNYRLKYEYGNWSKYDEKDEVKREYNIYADGEYKGKYNVLLLNKLYIYDEKDDQVDISGFVLGHRGTLAMDIFNVTNNEKLDDIDKYAVEKALSKLNLKTTYNLSFIQKSEIDIDNDKKTERVYCISNYYTEENTDERFSIIFVMDDNDDLDIIAKEITSNEKVNISKIYSIINLFDIKKDKKLEVLYQDEYTMGNSKDVCLYLYNLNSKKEIKNFCK